MSKEFDKLMSAHEESDRYYIDDINEVRARVKEEFENADKLGLGKVFIIFSLGSMSILFVLFFYYTVFLK